MRVQAHCLIVLVISARLAAGQVVPSGPEYSPWVSSSSARHRYLEPFASIRQVNFANLWYYIGDGETGELFQLQHGKFRNVYTVDGINRGFDEVTLDHVDYFQPGKSEREGALVALTHSYGGGSSCTDGIVLVFQIEDGGLVVTQQLNYNRQADGTGTDFDPSTSILTIRARSRDDTPNCCPKSIDVVTFRWTGKELEEKSHRAVPIERK
jgi:hypothetical protein